MLFLPRTGQLQGPQHREEASLEQMLATEPPFLPHPSCTHLRTSQSLQGGGEGPSQPGREHCTCRCEPMLRLPASLTLESILFFLMVISCQTPLDGK